MKARVPKVEVKPLVLFYGIEGEKKERLTALLDRESILYKEAADADLGQKTGYLCGLAGFEAAENAEREAFPHEAVIFCGLNDRLLDRVLKLLRENDLRVDRKAAVTPTNQHWPLGDLLREIDREHTEMSKRR